LHVPRSIFLRHSRPCFCNCKLVPTKTASGSSFALVILSEAKNLSFYLPTKRHRKHEKIRTTNITFATFELFCGKKKKELTAENAESAEKD